MGGASGTNGRDEKCVTTFQLENLKGRNHLGGLRYNFN
jgi:hypothetical protein